MATETSVFTALGREARILSIAQQLSRVHLLKHAEDGLPVSREERQALMDGVMARAEVIDRDLAPLLVDTSHGSAVVEGTSGLMGDVVPAEASDEPVVLRDFPAVRECLEQMSFAELLMLVDAGLVPAESARLVRWLCPTDRTDKAVASFLLAQSKPSSGISSSSTPPSLPRPHAPYTHRPMRPGPFPARSRFSGHQMRPPHAPPPMPMHSYSTQGLPPQGLPPARMAEHALLPEPTAPYYPGNPMRGGRAMPHSTQQQAQQGRAQNGASNRGAPQAGHSSGRHTADSPQYTHVYAQQQQQQQQLHGLHMRPPYAMMPQPQLQHSGVLYPGAQGMPRPGLLMRPGSQGLSLDRLSLDRPHPQHGAGAGSMGAGSMPPGPPGGMPYYAPYVHPSVPYHNLAALPLQQQPPLPPYGSAHRAAVPPGLPLGHGHDSHAGHVGTYWPPSQQPTGYSIYNPSQ